MQLELDFAVCALADYDEDGHLQMQTDSPGVQGKSGTRPAETLLPLGFLARGLDPEKGAAENEVGLGVPMLTITSGDVRYVMPFNDPRAVEKLPKLRKGGRMLWGGAGEYRSVLIIDGEDPDGQDRAGSIIFGAAFNKGGKKKSLGLSFNVRTAGEEEIILAHADGQRITMSAGGSSPIVLSAANGQNFIQLDNDGTVLAGSVKVQGGMTVGDQLAALPLAVGPVVADLITAIVGTIMAVAAGASTIPTVVAGAPAQAAAPLPALVAALLAKLQTLHLKST